MACLTYRMSNKRNCSLDIYYDHVSFREYSMPGENLIELVDGAYAERLFFRVAMSKGEGAVGGTFYFTVMNVCEGEDFKYNYVNGWT